MKSVEVIENNNLSNDILEYHREKVKKAFLDSLEINPRSYNVSNPLADYLRTIEWVERYSPDKRAIESISSTLCGMAGFYSDLDNAWQMRRFIKFSQSPAFSNVPYVIEFGDLLTKIILTLKETGQSKSARIPLDMDALYWDTSLEIPYEISNAKSNFEKKEKVFRGLNKHSYRVNEVLWDLERYYEKIDKIIDITPKNKDDGYKKLSVFYHALKCMVFSEFFIQKTKT